MKVYLTKSITNQILFLRDNIYTDDTQIYCTFDTESLDEVIGSHDNCISDIRSCMVDHMQAQT